MVRFYKTVEVFLRREGAHGAVIGAGEGAGCAASKGRLAYPLFLPRFVREVYEGGGEKRIPGACGVHDVADVEGGNLAAVLPGAEEGAF